MSQAGHGSGVGADNLDVETLEGLGHLMPITDVEFRKIRDLVHARFGIFLTDQKRSLVVGRLQKLVRELDLGSFEAYYEHVRRDATGASLAELVNRISTNHTFFFREKEHFDYLLERVLPEICGRLREHGELDLRIWCAGCSSGEEAYTLAMLVQEYLGPERGRWQAGLLATDISQKVLRVAMDGRYDADRVAQLPSKLQRHFVDVGDGMLQVRPELKKEITFRRFNLMNARFPFKRPFHVIFCRNVMIYFDQPSREALVQRFFDHTAPGGYLFIGHSESLGRNRTPYGYVVPSVYRKGETS
jgi:chemotaxis protein methyltransferase CheR